MTLKTEAKGIDEHLREPLANVADLILPGTDLLPSGRAVGCHQELLNRVLNADPRLIGVVRTVGEQASGQVSITLRELKKWAGEELETFLRALNAAYYLAPEVQATLGYPGQARRPIATASPDELCDDDLIRPVLDRGPCYVPTPDARAC